MFVNIDVKLGQGVEKYLGKKMWMGQQIHYHDRYIVILWIFTLKTYTLCIVTTVSHDVTMWDGMNIYMSTSQTERHNCQHYTLSGETPVVVHITFQSSFSMSNTTKSTFSSTRLHPDVEKRPGRPGEYCSSSATLLTRSVVSVMFFPLNTSLIHNFTCFLSSGRNGTKAVMRCFWINSLCQSPPTQSEIHC